MVRYLSPASGTPPGPLTQGAFWGNALQILLCPEIFLLKHIIKTKIKKIFVPPQTLRPDYGPVRRPPGAYDPTGSNGSAEEALHVGSCSTQM